MRTYVPGDERAAVVLGAMHSDEQLATLIELAALFELVVLNELPVLDESLASTDSAALVDEEVGAHVGERLNARFRATMVARSVGWIA